MKYCPKCNEQFDEEIIKFCTKDGTPLIEDAQPSFTAMPSENVEDDLGEETVIIRKADTTGSGERIVIPTSQPAAVPPVRPRASQAYVPPPPQPNTAKTVVLTIFGTLFLLACGAGLFWFLQKDKPANMNVNTNMNANQNVNLNTNVGFDSNFNFNANSNFNTNLNTNLNANVKTPTPSPTTSPTPKPSPSVTPSPTATPAASPTPTRPANTNRPATTPTPRMGPRPPTMTGNRPPGNEN
ncbi:MAG: hypothetical protein IPI64_13770 [Chloracidobacterium sp.]|nr:hypothetical protein [Chloracidobacterium sp.]